MNVHNETGGYILPCSFNVLKLIMVHMFTMNRVVQWNFNPGTSYMVFK